MIKQPRSSRTSRSRKPVATASITDVARQAGTSIATVSRVLNAHPYVSKDTTQRVRRAMRQLNFHPSGRGRSLRSGKRQTIGVLTPISRIAPHDPQRMNFLINELSRALTAESYHMNLEALVIPDSGQLTVPVIVAAQEVDGLIVVGHLEDNKLEQAAQWGLPICLTDNRYEHPLFHSATTDHYSGACEAVRYLAAMGRRRIKFIHGSLAYPGTRARYEGFIDSMREIGEPVGDDSLVAVPTDQQHYRGAYFATKKCMEQSRDIDALFFVNDWFAIGGLCAIQQMGLSVPDDISIVGYDDNWMARQVQPALTTVDSNTGQLCDMAAQSIVRAVEKKPAQCMHSVVEARLVVRESTAMAKSPV